MHKLLDQVLGEINPAFKEKAARLTAQERRILMDGAFASYEAGKYGEASSLFTLLVLDQPLEENFWRGLASSRQMEEKYREALPAWSMVALLCAEDPFPHFHAAECMISLGDRGEAMKGLQCAEKLLKEPHRDLREKINLLKKLCQ